MGWPPAVVIVVRHGARLDAADNQWHLTSPTPYDPPLTYGGWNQSKALGARIANILRVRETDDELFEDNGEVRRKRRHKVIIHSSPFLRCVQTSVAISAGLAQNPGHLQPTPPISRTHSRASHMHSSPRIRPTVDTSSVTLPSIPEPVSKTGGQSAAENIRKSTIRIDAFLGEWLSPDYFELITPPPSSIMMVASAKADLLRREDYSYLKQGKTGTGSANTGFPGGWNSPVVAAIKDEEEAPFSSLSNLAQVLPRRDRTSSLSNMGEDINSHRARSPSHLVVAPSGEHGIYQPPVPAYAISNSDPTPPGYVAHARDACCDVDYQWDSMREPQNWGNGGEYGEEWSSMHKRFRSGLQKMVTWYSESDNPGKVFPKTPTTPISKPAEAGDADEDTDLVLILVTHGAGCNALIGALTNHPALIDVSMSSLTLAVRKPSPVPTPASTPGTTPKSHSRSASGSISVADQYDVKLTANTEHLRSTSSTPISSRPTSIGGFFREKQNSVGGSDIASSNPRSIHTSGNFGSIRRTASLATNVPKGYLAGRQGSIGLWSAPAPSSEITIPDEQDDIILNFGDADTPASSPPPDKELALVEKELDEHEVVAPLAAGLWGSPRPPGQAETIRESGPKRRWTVNERA